MIIAAIVVNVPPEPISIDGTNSGFRVCLRSSRSIPSSYLIESSLVRV